MWTVARPAASAQDTFIICISRIKDADLRTRLTSIVPAIESAADDYETKASNRLLHTIAVSNSVQGVVTSAEMVKVYDQRMAAKGAPGRPIYDQIKMLPVGDRCPFCDQRNVTTLDHVLPKAGFPSLAVTPINLVGSCMECNKAKQSFHPTCAADTYLHPYFDDVTAEQWLFAQVRQGRPCAVKYEISKPSSWDPTTYARVDAQFSALDLARLYASEAARELANIRFNLRTHFVSGGANAVKQEALRQWRSRYANRKNSWQTALYGALYNDDWFCAGGFDF